MLAAALRALGNAKPSIARSLLDLSRHRCWVLPIQVVDVLAAALRALGNAKPDVARGLLDLASRGAGCRGDNAHAGGRWAPGTILGGSKACILVAAIVAV